MEYCATIDDLLTPIKPRQYYTLRWMLLRELIEWNGAKGGILGHKTGMGKTYLSLLLIYLDRNLSNKYGKKRSPTLVIAGNDTINIWIDQIKTHFKPNTFTYMIMKDKKEYTLEGIKSMDIVFATYEMLVNVYKHCIDVSVDYLNGEYNQARNTQGYEDEFDHCIDRYSEREKKMRMNAVGCTKTSIKHNIENEFLCGKSKAWGRNSIIRKVWVMESNTFQHEKLTKPAKSCSGRDQRSILFHVEWQRVMFDEAHCARNRSAVTFMSCMALCALSFWAITATPVQNTKSDLLSIYMLIRYSHPCFITDRGTYVKDNKIPDSFYMNSNMVLCSIRKKIKNSTYYSIQYIVDNTSTDPYVLNELWPEGVVDSFYNANPAGRNSFSTIILDKIRTLYRSIKENTDYPIRNAIQEKMTFVNNFLFRLNHCLKKPITTHFRQYVSDYMNDGRAIEADTDVEMQDAYYSDYPVNNESNSERSYESNDSNGKKRKFDQIQDDSEDSDSSCSNPRKRQKIKKKNTYFVVNTEFDTREERIIYNHYQKWFVNKYPSPSNLVKKSDEPEPKPIQPVAKSSAVPYNLQNKITIRSPDEYKKTKLLQMQQKKKTPEQPRKPHDTVNIFVSIERMRQACVHPLLCLSEEVVGDCDVDNFTDVQKNAIYEKMKIEWSDMSQEDLEIAKNVLDPNFVPTKFKVVKSYIENCVEEDEKVIIYCWYVGALKMLKTYLEKEFGFETGLYCGTVSSTERVRVVEEFKKNQKCKVLLATPGTAAESLNLQRANRVILLTPWWNPKQDEQIEGRIRRTGQCRDTTICYFLVSNSVEEYIYKIARWKDEESKVVMHDTNDNQNQFHYQFMQLDFKVIKAILKKTKDETLLAKLNSKNIQVVPREDIFKSLPQFQMLDEPKILRGGEWNFVYFPIASDTLASNISNSRLNDVDIDTVMEKKKYTEMSKFEMVNIVYKEIVSEQMQPN